MERKGNNIAEDTFLHWMDVERYMAEFKEGNLIIMKNVKQFYGILL